MAGKQCLNKIKNIASALLNEKGFDACLQKLEILSAEKGRCTAAITIEPGHLNGLGGLHGGFTATLLDQVSNYALLATEKSPPGVSIDLHVSYLKVAKAGDKLIIDANTIKAGKTLAFLEVLITNENTGDVVAKGGQTIFIGIA